MPNRCVRGSALCHTADRPSLDHPVYHFCREVREIGTMRGAPGGEARPIGCARTRNKVATPGLREAFGAEVALKEPVSRTGGGFDRPERRSPHAWVLTNGEWCAALQAVPPRPLASKGFGPGRGRGHCRDRPTRERTAREGVGAVEGVAGSVRVSQPQGFVEGGTCKARRTRRKTKEPEEESEERHAEQQAKPAFALAL